MKLHLVLLSLCALAPPTAIAQQPDKAPLIKQVLYSRTNTKGLREFVPRGGKSRFWGQSDLTYRDRKVWIHVFDVSKTRFQEDENNTEGEQKVGVDLFVFNSQKKLMRISSTRFVYGRYGGYKRGGDYESIGVETLWLDPTQQKMPIIRVALQDPNGLYGMITQDAICVFSRGLNEKSVVEKRFGYGASNGASWNSWSTEFAVMNDNLTGIIYRQDAFGVRRRTFYKWENDRFKPFSRKEMNNLGVDDEERKEVEVPLDAS